MLAPMLTTLLKKNPLQSAIIVVKSGICQEIARMREFNMREAMLTEETTSQDQEILVSIAEELGIGQKSAHLARETMTA